MSKTIRIDITNEDITQGVPGRASSCAIARSVNRILDGEPVSVMSIGLIFERLNIMIELPLEAHYFIKMFDHSKLFATVFSTSDGCIPQVSHIRMSGKEKLEPFSFQLEISDELYDQLFGLEKNNLVDDAACVLPTTVPLESTVASAVSEANIKQNTKQNKTQNVCQLT